MNLEQFEKARIDRDISLLLRPVEGMRVQLTSGETYSIFKTDAKDESKGWWVAFEVYDPSLDDMLPFLRECIRGGASVRSPLICADCGGDRSDESPDCPNCDEKDMVSAPWPWSDTVMALPELGEVAQ